MTMPITFIVPVTSAEPPRQLGRVLIPGDLKNAPHIGDQIKLDQIPVPRSVVKVDFKIAEGRVFVKLQSLELPTTGEAQTLLEMLTSNGLTLAQDN